MIRIAYLCGEYPRATDTFIQREIACLRNEGIYIETISIRRPILRERGTSEQLSERKNTYYLLPVFPLSLLWVHCSLFLRNPVKYISTFFFSIKTRSPGIKSFVYQVFYFLEAGLVVSRMKKLNLRHIHNHAPDACGYVAMFASQLSEITYSLTLHGFAIFSEPQRWRLSEKIDKSLFAICISSFGKSQAMLWSNRKNWSKLHTIHCGIDFSDREQKKHNKIGKNILFVGRIDHVKGLPLLIDAIESLLKELPNIHLHIVGDGPGRNELEEYIEEKCVGDKITIYGYKSQAELIDFFLMADVFVLTSFYEGIPVVLMEAMSFGVPVVAPRITGIPELVDDGNNGFLFTPGDNNALELKIKELLLNPETRSVFSRFGKEKILLSFNQQKECQKLVRIMKNSICE